MRLWLRLTNFIPYFEVFRDDSKDWCFVRVEDESVAGYLRIFAVNLPLDGGDFVDSRLSGGTRPRFQLCGGAARNLHSPGSETKPNKALT